MRIQSWKSSEGTQYHTPMQEAEWSITAVAENAAATATRPAEPDRSHYITYVGGSYSGAVSGGEMLLKEGTTVVGDYFVHNDRGIPLTYPLRIAESTDASLTLAAGGLAVKGACTMQGYTA